MIKNYLTDKKLNTNPLKNISFSHRIIIDVGASDPRGTIKILDKSNDGKTDILFNKGYVN